MRIRVPIPSGEKIIHATTSRKSFLLYPCVTCGKHVLATRITQGSGSKTYHVLQSKSTKELAHENARIEAENDLNRKEVELLQFINVKHDYHVITERIVCPFCSSLQPFSDFPSGMFTKKKIQKKNEELKSIYTVEWPTLYTAFNMRGILESPYVGLLENLIKEKK